MGKKIKKKLNSQSGESIAETLVALLIAALALVMLAGAISAASNVVLASKDKVNKYYDKNESMITGGSEGEGTIRITSSTGSSFDLTLDPVTVNYYTNGEFGSKTVILYEVKK